MPQRPASAPAAATRKPRSYDSVRTMRNAIRRLVKFLQKEDGPTAVEYAVMLALIIVVCVGAVTTLGTNSRAKFTSVGTTLGGTGS